MPSPNEITANQTARLIGTPDAPVLVDLCLDEDFALDPALLPGAFRHPHDDVVALVSRFGDARVVLYRDLAPQAAGQLAVSLGLSRLYRDDLARLEAGPRLHDALYRRARDAVDERHDRPGTPVRDGAS